MDETAIEKLLEPFGLELNSGQIEQVRIYLNLLMRWNRKINLTSIRNEAECVTRHFGESLYLARWTQLQGKLLDIGAGAGFPGLALRIAVPTLTTILLEPAAKKRAFLKEVVRACEIPSVEVRPERLEEYVGQVHIPMFDTITARAVGNLGLLVPQALRLLKPKGQLCLWVGQEQGLALKTLPEEIHWDKPIPTPLARHREIWVGTHRK